MITVRCPCGAKLRAREEHEGKTTQCPRCKNTFLIPYSVPEEDETDDSDEVDLRPVPEKRRARSRRQPDRTRLYAIVGTIGALSVVVLAVTLYFAFRTPRDRDAGGSGGPGSFAGSMWSGTIDSAKSVPFVGATSTQIDGWSAKEGYKLVVVRAHLRPLKPTPPEGWTGDSGILKQLGDRSGDVLLDTGIATLDTGSTQSRMLGFLSDETDGGSAWIRAHATTMQSNATSRVAMVFSVPEKAQSITVQFTGGGSATIPVSP